MPAHLLFAGALVGYLASQIVELVRTIFTARFWILLYLVLRQAVASALSVAIGTLILFTEQGQDLLHALPERSVWTLAGFFAAAVLLWAVPTWYWGRVRLYLFDTRTATLWDDPAEPGQAGALTFGGGVGFISSLRTNFQGTVREIRLRMHRTLTEALVDQPLLDGIRVWVPRLLGFATLLTLTLALRAAAGTYSPNLYGIAPGTATATLRTLMWIALALAVVTLIFFVVRRYLLRFHRACVVPASHWFHLGNLPRWTILLVAAWAALTLLILVVMAIWPVPVSQWLGTPVLVFLWLGVFSYVATLLAWFREATGWPVLFVLGATVVVFSCWNENQLVEADPSPAHAARSGLLQRLDSWSQTAPPGPLFLVAAEGGGLRSGYWTALTLAHLQDAEPDFARRVFAINAVSGASLGAAVFKGGLVAGASPLRPGVEAFFETDFLSPVIGKLLWTDLASRVWFLPIRSWDRTLGLVHAWERRWRDVYGPGNQMAEPFLDLWAGDPDRVPVLMFDAVRAESGRLHVWSNVYWRDAAGLPSVANPPGTLHGVGSLADSVEGDLALSTAVVNSARFPYLLPAAGVIRGDTLWGRIGDGGYFENTGAEVALALYDVVTAAHEPERWHVIHIGGAGYRPERPAEIMPGVTVPLTTLLNTREARGEAALEELRRRVPPARFYELRQCHTTTLAGSSPPDTVPWVLGWTLSPIGRRIVADQLNGCPASPNAAELNRILAAIP